MSQSNETFQKNHKTREREGYGLALQSRHRAGKWQQEPIRKARQERHTGR